MAGTGRRLGRQRLHRRLADPRAGGAGLAGARFGAERHTEARQAREVLGWVLRPAAQNIADTARSLIALGLVRPWVRAR